MKNLVYIIVLAIFLVSCNSDEGIEETQPNILLIMVDDMGYTDTQPYGGEINTPAIDMLAKKGMLFTDFHTSVSCSPTRSMLMTGTDNHLVGLGNMGELLSPNQVGKPGYEGILTDDVVSMATRLKDEGYHTYMVGKWHLGEEDVNHRPFGRGFEETFVLLEGASSHYDDKTGFVPKQPTTNYSSNGKLV